MVVLGFCLVSFPVGQQFHHCLVGAFNGNASLLFEAKEGIGSQETKILLIKGLDEVVGLWCAVFHSCLTHKRGVAGVEGEIRSVDSLFERR